MPVVVNEFEVVAEPTQQPQQQSAAPAPTGSRAPDFEVMLSEQHRRDERVRAY